MLPSNFFERQAQAKSKTSYLLFLFLVALLATVASVTALILAAVHYRDPALAEQLSRNPFYYLAVGGALAIVIGLTSLVRIASLKLSGGRGVLNNFRHRIVEANSSNEKDRLLRNVVEEMSIASGVPMPCVAVIEDESCINAFAAGFQNKDSVIAVTEGTLAQLSRDELQGVVGHEFSHLLNKDSAMNLKITGAIYGLIVLSLLGRILMRSRSRGYGNRSRNDGAAVIALVGLGIFVIGGIGKIFSLIIQAAVSRQREFLADASAVQFTRNPLGIGGALIKIAGLPQKTVLAPKAGEMNHFFFFTDPSALFATHPPLTARIKAIAPELLKDADLKAMEAIPPHLRNPFANANAEISKFTPDLKTASETHESVPALIAATFLSTDETLLEKQSLIISRIFSEELLKDSMKLARDLSYVDLKTRYLLVEKAVAEINRTAADHRKLLEMIRALVLIDKKVSFFEMLVWVLTVDASSKRSAYQPERSKTVDGNYREAVLLLKLLSDTSNLAGSKSDIALHRALKSYWPEGPGYVAAVQSHNLGSLSMHRIGEAIEEMKFSSENVRRSFMKAALHLASADNVIETREWVLLRALGILLECPVPLPESA